MTLNECGPLVDAEIRRVIDSRSQTGAFYDMMRYHLGWSGAEPASGSGRRGKRYRAALCLLTCEALEGQRAQALPMAASIELLHNFSLVHDDIEDGDEVRRGHPTLWKVWGLNHGINTGDGMHALANLAALEVEARGVDPRTALRLLRILQAAGVELCEGQYQDLRNERREDVSILEYMKLISGKTAALFGAATEAGAVLAGGDADKWRRFGRLLGMAFQIRDDALGLFRVEQLQKQGVSDLVRRKRTLPVLYALERSAELQALLQRPVLEEAELQRALRLIADSGAPAYCEQLAQSYGREALVLLESERNDTVAFQELHKVARLLLPEDEAFQPGSSAAPALQAAHRRPRPGRFAAALQGLREGGSAVRHLLGSLKRFPLSFTVFPTEPLQLFAPRSPYEGQGHGRFEPAEVSREELRAYATTRVEPLMGCLGEMRDELPLSLPELTQIPGVLRSLREFDRQYTRWTEDWLRSWSDEYPVIGERHDRRLPVKMTLWAYCMLSGDSFESVAARGGLGLFTSSWNLMVMLDRVVDDRSFREDLRLQGRPLSEGEFQRHLWSHDESAMWASIFAREKAASPFGPEAQRYLEGKTRVMYSAWFKAEHGHLPPAAGRRTMEDIFNYKFDTFVLPTEAFAAMLSGAECLDERAQRREALLSAFMFASLVVDEAIDFGEDIVFLRELIFPALKERQEGAGMEAYVRSQSSPESVTFPFDLRTFPQTTRNALGLFQAVLRGIDNDRISALLKAALIILPSLPKRASASASPVQYLQFY